MLTRANEKFEYQVETDVGKKRKINQDAVVAYTSGDAGLFVVADGMGGHSEGEYASGEIVAACGRFWKDHAGRMEAAEFSSLLSELEKTLQNVNYAIYNKFKQAGVCGSTVVVLFAVEEYYAVISVGDSRIYTCLDGKSILLTVDDIWDNLASTKTLFSEEERRQHPNRGKLVHAIGISETTEMYVQTGRLKKNQVFLLCSDGLYKFCPEKEIRENLQKVRTAASMKEVSTTYLDKVFENGAKDNVSFIIVRNTGDEAAGQVVTKPQPKQWNWKTIVIAAAAALAVLVLVAIVAFVPQAVSGKKMAAQLQVAENYLNEEKYEQAEAVYLAVIEVEPENEEAYLGLAEVYIVSGKYEEAKDVLEGALKKLGENDAMREMLKKAEELAEIVPTSTPMPTPTPEPTATSTPVPTTMPEPTATATPEPTATSTPVPTPTATPTPEPTATPTPEPTATPTPEPTATPTPEPTATPTPEPTETPTLEPTATPTPEPTATPTPESTATPTPEPTATPTPEPTATPTPEPTATPTPEPTEIPIPEDSMFELNLEGETLQIIRVKDTAIVEIVVPEEVAGIQVTSIGAYAFFGCSNLESIQLPSNITNIEESAFEQCDKLEVIYAPEGSYAAEWAQNAEYIVSANKVEEDQAND